MYRTKNCGELSEKDIGQEVVIAGWLANVRDIGQVVFAVVRDFFGITQVVGSGEWIARLKAIPTESTIRVKGKVVARSSPNPNIPTGMIEIEPSEIEVLGICSEQLPFEISISDESREDLRLKYRFLDLRNPKIKDKIVMRSHFIKELRDRLYEMGFLEFQTPILTSSSPEGARDYLVPSRVYAGQFYALPQAPQQFKQLLMISGFDKYFQIAPCFRDEDSRADRSPGEFYQLDLEMSYATQEDVFSAMEELLPKVFNKFSALRIDQVPFPRITYADAMALYGSDKPDLRNPLIYTDASELISALNIPFLKGFNTRALKVENAKATRKELDALTMEFKSETSALTYVKMDEKGELSGGIAKFFDQTLKAELISLLELKPLDLVFFASALKPKDKVFGLIRNEIGSRLGLIEKGIYKFCWIVDFPMFEFDEENNKIDFSHNPFSMPQGGLEALNSKPPLEILAYQYDIVCNGIELSSGAVRNHDTKIMERAFQIAGYDRNVLEEKFSALFNAFKYGAPPHAGIAPGVDRMLMIICDEPNIREVIAFPMNKNARDLLMNAPSCVSDKQLKEANIAIVKKEM